MRNNKGIYHLSFFNCLAMLHVLVEYSEALGGGARHCFRYTYGSFHPNTPGTQIMDMVKLFTPF